FAAVHVEIVTSAGPVAERQCTMMSISENCPFDSPKISQPFDTSPIASTAFAAAMLRRTSRPDARFRLNVSMLTWMPFQAVKFHLVNRIRKKTTGQGVFAVRAGFSDPLYPAAPPPPPQRVGCRAFARIGPPRVRRERARLTASDALAAHGGDTRRCRKPRATPQLKSFTSSTPAHGTPPSPPRRFSDCGKSRTAFASSADPRTDRGRPEGDGYGRGCRRERCTSCTGDAEKGTRAANAGT